MTSYTSNAQPRIGVVLTKQPNGNVTVEIEAPESPNVDILNPRIVFTDENWNTPQQVRLGGCFLFEKSLSLTAKANAGGGFAGTEKDELTITISPQESCANDSTSITTFKDKNPANPTVHTSPGDSNFAEFNSPFFIILRAFLQPFFFAFGMASALYKTISPQHQRQEGSTKSTQSHDAEPNTLIDKGPLTTIATPTIADEVSANSGTIETILLGPGQ